MREIETEEIIKSFSKIRYTNPLDLSQAQTERRQGIVGKSTGVFGRFWFALPKGQALFKMFFTEEADFADKNQSARPQNLLMVNELLCSQLAQQIGLPCAKYDLAFYNGYDGVVSYNLLEENEVIEDFMRGTFQRFLSAIDVEGEYNPTTTFDPQMKKDVFKAVIFQLLTLQTDGKTDGYVFARDQETDALRFAGLCDNEYAFNVSTFQRDGDFGDIYGLFGKGFDPLDVIEALNARISLRYIRLTDGEEGEHGYFLRNSYFSRIQEACKFVQDFPEYQKPLQEILQSLNPQKAFEAVKNQNCVEVDSSYQKYVSKLIELGVKEFEKELSQEQS